MSDDDLIKRGDVSALFKDWLLYAPSGISVSDDIHEAIADLPAVSAPHPYSLRPDLQKIVDNPKNAPQWDTVRDRMADIDAPVAELVEAWAVFDPNWGEPTPLLTTIRDTEEEAIGAAIATQERGASMYSGYSIHCVPQLLGDWQKMESHGYKTGRVSLRAALARIGGQ